MPSKCPPVWWVQAASLAESYSTWKMVNGSFEFESEHLSDQRLTWSVARTMPIPAGDSPCRFNQLQLSDGELEVDDYGGLSSRV